MRVTNNRSRKIEREIKLLLREKFRRKEWNESTLTITGYERPWTEHESEILQGKLDILSYLNEEACMRLSEVAMSELENWNLVKNRELAGVF